MTSSDQAFYGLVAVTNDNSNYVALNCTLLTGSGSSVGIISNGTGTVAGTILSPTTVANMSVGFYLSGTGPGSNVNLSGVAVINNSIVINTIL